MQKIYNISTFLFIIFLFVSTAVLAQGTTGKVSGKITTSDGQPAPGVTVTIKEINRSTSTNANGTYIISNVKPGSYTLVASLIGSKTEVKSITVTAGETLKPSFTLSENASQLQEVVLSASGSINKPVSFGKAGIKPLDLPQSTGVISNTVITDQQAVRVGDVIRNVSGVSLTQTRGGVAETFSARGYSIGIAGAGGSIFKNGVITNTQGFPDASTLESIEVLKGSSALLYGNVSGGVVINLVTKKPRFEWGGQVSMLAGSFNQYKPTVDVYGPITKNLAFRLIGTHEQADSYRDVVNTNRSYVNPSLLYKVGNKTDILLEFDYLKSNIVPDAGVGIPNSRITVTEVPDAPRNRFINSVWAYNNTRQGSGFLTINHHFNDNWKLTAIGSAQKTTVRGFGVGVPMTVAANGDWARTLNAVKSAEDDYTGQLNLNGVFKTGGVNHQLLFGADFVRIVAENNTFSYFSENGSTSSNYGTININNPTLNARTDLPSYNTVQLTTSPQNRTGVYFQDLITLTSKFKVLAGLRWSYQEAFIPTIYNFVTQQEVPNSVSNIVISKAFTPKVALIYQPVETSSLYASYTNNFTPNSGTNVDNKPLEPSIIDQYEVGVKNQFFNGKLSANLSVYKIINSNFSQPVINQPGFRQLNGETTSDGLEVDFNGTLSKNFYFIAGYGYNNMRYTNTTGETGAQVEGERLINNPKHTANGAIFYTFDRYKIKGLKLGATAFYTGKRLGGNNNVVGLNGGLNNTTAALTSYNALVPLSGFATVDISAGYTYRKVSLIAKVANIFNELNYIVHDRYSINPIPPRMLVTTLAYKF
ncbi:TonB-dependent siderophore receptor [Mucilaginibacter terrae]|uniref:TonB-dependent siderophore receptor n=1 Tax=Mucilaginibacter terrae TaxID=1955052 RepID=UPI00362948E9